MASGITLDKARTERSYPEIRVALLHERGSSLRTIAARLGIDRAYVSRVNSGIKGGPAARRVERAIARELGLLLRDAFPERDTERAA